MVGGGEGGNGLVEKVEGRMNKEVEESRRGHSVF